MQPFQRINSEIQTAGIERPEALIDEQCRRKASFPAHSRKGERKGERHQKTLSARKAARSAGFTAHVAIFDLQREIRRAA